MGKREWVVILAAAVAGIGSADAARASEVVVALGPTVVNVNGSPGVGVDLEISQPGTGQVRIVDRDIDDDLQEGFDPDDHCTEAPADTITCTGLDASFQLIVDGSDQADAIAIDDAATMFTQLRGGAGNDVILGGGSLDFIEGGTGTDDLDGRGNSDTILNGRDDNRVDAASDGADILADSGASGLDVVSFEHQTAPITARVNGVADDGANGEGDAIGAGFERIIGTTEDDTIVGGPQAEDLYGGDGADDITGGAGGDGLLGEAGDDTLRAADGVFDGPVDCGAGAADVAFVDASDTVVQGCETTTTVTPEPTPTATPGPEPTATTSGPSGPAGPGGTGGPGSGAAGPGALVLGPAQSTSFTNRMPRLTGKKFAAARNELLAKVAWAEVDLEFRKGCKLGDLLEVVKQSPLSGASLPNHQRDPVDATLTVCMADATYLRDCDLGDLRSDIKRLGRGALDADIATVVLGKVNRCKVDYDVKIVKSAEEARIALAAQKAKQQKAEIRAGISCPARGDLRPIVTDGYTPSLRAFGLRQSGPGGWTLPAGYQSFVEVGVFDRAVNWPEAKVYADADALIDVPNKRPAPRMTQKGRAVFGVFPLRPGKIRVCVVQETGSDEVLSAAVEITVAAKPPVGTIWETVSGRKISVTKDGPVAVSSARPVARAAFLDRIWDAIVGLFDGRSRTVNTEESSSRPKQQRTQTASTQARIGVGQIALNGVLSSDPKIPLQKVGTCIVSGADGQRRLASCPVLEAQGDAALVGTANSGAGMVAAGAGNIVAAGAGNIVAAGAGNLIGADGSSLIGADGSSLIGADGSSLIGADGSSLVADGGGNVIAAVGSKVLMPDLAAMVAAGGGNIVAAGGGNLVGNAGGNLVPPGRLP